MSGGRPSRPGGSQPRQRLSIEAAAYAAGDGERTRPSLVTTPGRCSRTSRVAARRHRKRVSLRAPDRYLTRRERLAVRTSKHWIAGYEHLIAEWHPTKNVDLFPYAVPAGSTKRVWWRCPRGVDHVWSTQARVRAKQGSGCPFCAGRRVSVTNSLATLFPAVAAEWHPKRNGKLRPEQVVAGTGRAVWWRCAAGEDHVWRAIVDARTRNGNGCPFCAGQRVCRSNSLATIAPGIARQWHPTRNGRVTPRKVVAGSPRLAWWRCSRGSDHVWRATVRMRVANESGCPFCSRRRVTSATSLRAERPDLAAEWDAERNGDLTPDEVVAGSGKAVWWHCRRNRGHRWRARVVSRIEGRGCPFCASRLVDATNSLAARAPHLVIEWDPIRNGDATPDRFTSGSGKYAWWRCARDQRHVWRAKILNRVHGTGCPTCYAARNSLTT